MNLTNWIGGSSEARKLHRRQRPKAGLWGWVLMVDGEWGQVAMEMDLTQTETGIMDIVTRMVPAILLTIETAFLLHRLTKSGDQRGDKIETIDRTPGYLLVLLQLIMHPMVAKGVQMDTDRAHETLIADPRGTDLEARI
jgi:hypothetical protein